MKIIFVISAMNGGGAERVIATLANRYAASGDTITILMVAGEESAYPLHEKVKILSIGRPSGGNPFIQLKRLYNMHQYFKQHKDSHIVSFGTQINLFTVISCIGIKNNITVSERNDPNRCNYVRFRNMLYKLADKFVFQTEDAQRCFPSEIINRSIVIPNPIRRELPDVYDGKREKKIAAVGRLEKQKNHRLLLVSFAGFYERHPDYELHIFGKGSLKDDLCKLTVELGIEKSVIFEGFTHNILEKIKSYGMYVLSSDYEGISNSLMEALALGIPCISTDCPIGGSNLCIEDGVNGILVPVNDRESLQSAMDSIAENEELAKRFSQNAVKIRETFAEERIADLWHQYIEEKRRTD